MKKRMIMALVVFIISILIIFPGFYTFFQATAVSATGEENCQCECSCTCPNGNQNFNLNTNENQNYDFSDQIIINEILPNPEGSDQEGEFIELYNKGNRDVNLNAWSIGDASKIFTISSEDFNTTVISSKGYFVVYRPVSNITLNNTGSEIVRLMQPDESMVDQVEYIGSFENMSYSLDENNEWQWADPTPDEKNIFNNINENSNVNQNENSNINLNVNSNENMNQNTNQNTNQQNSYSNQIIITEIFPNPEGPDEELEFIELKNISNQAINLEGWKLSDATSKTYTLGQQINPGEYLAIYRSESSIVLNNSSDTVELFWPNEELLWNIEYSGCTEAQSFAYDGNNWSWTTEVTPGEENIISRQIAENDNIENTESSSASGVSSKNGKEIHQIPIIEVKKLQKNDLVKLDGQAIVEPGIFGDQYFYLQDETGGIKIYFSKKDFPDIQRGDILEVNGKVSIVKEGVKINISSQSDISILEHSELNPKKVKIEEFSQNIVNTLIQLEGEIVDKKSASFILQDSELEMANIKIKKSANINTKEINEKDIGIIIGVLIQNGNEYEVWPRSISDIENLNQNVQENNKQSKEEEKTNEISSSIFNLPPNNKTRQIIIGLLSGGLVTIVALGVIGARYYKKKYSLGKN